MPIEYSPLLETETSQLPAVQWEALVSNPLYQIMFPKGSTPALLDYTFVQTQKHSRFPSVRFYKVTDTDCLPSKIVGFAKWIIYDTERDSPEEGQWRPEEQRDPAPVEDVDIEVAKEWTPKLREIRRITMGGKPHCRESSISYILENGVTRSTCPLIKARSHSPRHPSRSSQLPRTRHWCLPGKFGHGHRRRRKLAMLP